ncbi:MAG: hypothetical protein EBR82_25450 [Caulobacteraceae bacterium]|nr:hypothetical protein [Caulobacteraceae bacterium]
MLLTIRPIILRAPDKGGESGGSTAPGYDPAILAALPGSELLATRDRQASAPAADDTDDDDDTDLKVEPVETTLDPDTPEPDDDDDDTTTDDESDEETSDDPDAGEDEDDDDDKSDEDTDDQTDPETKTWPESAQKRVHKLTAQKGEAERERDAIKAEKAAIEQQLAELQARGPAPIVAPTPANPLAHVTQARDLEAHAAFSEQLQGWALEHIATGGTMPPELDAAITGRTIEQATAEPTEYEPKTIGRLLKLAQDRLTKDIPQRAQYLQADAAASQYVQQHYPAMLKPETEEGKLYAQYLHQFPEIQRFPNWRVAMTDLVRGALFRTKEEAERTTAKETARKGAVSKPADGAKPAKTKLAPVVPGAVRPGGANPRGGKPNRGPKLSASMTSDELAAALLEQQNAA